MATGEKEKGMERLMAQALRKSLQAGGAECPAPETLAAYYDRSLKASEAAQCELHLSRCLHCQQVLAALAISEPKESPSREAALVALIRRYLNWRWLAPAAAAAAAVALWVAIRPAPIGQQAPAAAEADRMAQAANAVKAVPTKPTQVARNNGPPKLSVESKLKAETPAAARLAQPSSIRPELEKPGDALRSLSEHPGRTETAERGTGVQPAAVPTGTPAADAARVVTAEEKDKADQKRALPPAPAEQVVVESAPQVAESGKIAALKAQPQSGTPAYAVPPAAPGREASKYSTKDSAEARGQLARGLAQPTPGTAIPTAAARSAFFLIATSNPAVIWRVSRGGKIERSSNAGHTWQAQPSGVTTDLVAGSAPSETVCWVVGRAGTILRTTDGEHWEKISSPTRLDLASIEAQDALHATLVAADQTRYFTEDGGQTWRPQ